MSFVPALCRNDFLSIIHLPGHWRFEKTTSSSCFYIIQRAKQKRPLPIPGPTTVTGHPKRANQREIGVFSNWTLFLSVFPPDLRP
jgi:hypothetical protein